LDIDLPHRVVIAPKSASWARQRHALLTNAGDAAVARVLSFGQAVGRCSTGAAWIPAEVAAELLGDHLVVQRPRRLLVDLRLPAFAGEEMCTQQRLPTCDQRPADNSMRDLRVLGDTGQTGDASSGGVGLLCAHAALLDRQVGGVAGRENASVGAAPSMGRNRCVASPGMPRTFGPLILGSVTIRSGCWCKATRPKDEVLRTDDIDAG
jgi:hypothetical protein